ncbi:hypothetical protein CW304_01050 [Bacillus sp. UFRGS-B20]|nr:hypothetical protein CW304_01050 [Bacillus sp. UFRGS-B20]
MLTRINWAIETCANLSFLKLLPEGWLVITRLLFLQKNPHPFCCPTARSGFCCSLRRKLLRKKYAETHVQSAF